MRDKWSAWTPFTPAAAAEAPAQAGVYVLADGKVIDPGTLQAGELPDRAVTYVGWASNLREALAVHFTPFESERNKRLAAYVRRGGLYLTYLVHAEPRHLAQTLVDRFAPPCNQ
jgi:excinuclease UvrABC nuclease subunit